MIAVAMTESCRDDGPLIPPLLRAEAEAEAGGCQGLTIGGASLLRYVYTR